MRQATAALAHATPDEVTEQFRDWIAVHSTALEPFRGHEQHSVADTVRFDRALQAMLTDDGWLRLGWPMPLGGLGGSAVLRAVVYEELWAAGIRVPEPLLFAEVIGPAVARFAPELTAEHLVPMLRGDETWAQCFSEPDAGSDLASLRLRAEHVEERYSLVGQKIWTTIGHTATHLLVLGRTGPADSGHRGLSMFFVDADTPGIEIRPITCAGGRDDLAEVFFDGVAVPVDRRVGDEGAGWSVAMFLLQFERGMYAWQRQAWLFSRFSELLRRDDVATGEVSDLRLGETFEALFALRARCATTVRRLADGEVMGPETSIDKVLLARAEQTLMDTAHELLGPALEIGADPRDESWRWEWWYSRPASIYGGAGEVQRNIIAERILGLPR